MYKKHFPKVLLLVVSLVVLAFSATYAYYRASFNPNTTTASTGIFNVTSSLNAADSNSIHNENMELINTEEVAKRADSLTFTVTSTADTTVDGKFEVYLKGMEMAEKLKSEYFKWELLQKDDSGDLNPVSSGDFSDVTLGEMVSDIDDTHPRKIVKVNDLKLTTDAVSLPAKQTVTLVLRMYLLNDLNENQIELTECSFKGHLYLEAVPVSKQQS